MLLVSSPTNYTQVEGSAVTSSTPHLELSHIEPISNHVPHNSSVSSVLRQDSVPAPEHHHNSLLYSNVEHLATQDTSVQPVDMALTNLAEGVTVNSAQVSVRRGMYRVLLKGVQANQTLYSDLKDNWDKLKNPKKSRQFGTLP